MMLLLPGNAKSLLDALGDDGTHYGWLLTPSRTMTESNTAGWRYGIDNECFTRPFDSARYQRAISRILEAHGNDACVFATAPDVVCDAPATLKLAEQWLPRLRALGVPAGLVAQDGLKYKDVPWDEIDALFIGGSTEWKLGDEAADLIASAQRQCKWTHIGRVNSVRRAVHFKVFPDSVDGTAWAKHPAQYARKWRNWIEAGQHQQTGLPPGPGDYHDFTDTLDDIDEDDWEYQLWDARQNYLRKYGDEKI